MAQLSEKLVRDAIKCIREERKLMLTINEVDQALHAWLTLNDLVQPPPLAAAETSDAQPWRCTVCKNMNPDDATHCRQCEYSRYVTRAGQKVPREGKQ